MIQCHYIPYKQKIWHGNKFDGWRFLKRISKFYLSCFYWLSSISVSCLFQGSYSYFLAYFELRVHTMTLYKYFKSKLLCRSQANEYLTIRDIESANEKWKLRSPRLRCHLKRNVKYRHATNTAEERASIGRYSSDQLDQWLHLGTLQKNLIAQ